MRTIPLKTTWVIGERWPVRPFRGQIDDPRFPNQTVLYQVDFRYPPYQIEERQNLTIVSLDHVFLWDGDEDEFARWGRTTGQEEIALHIADIINRLIDLVQATFTATESNPFPHIRRVGPRDFLALDSLYGTRRQNLISYAMPALDARMARRAISMVSNVNFSTFEEPLREKVKIIRAVELLNGGYHTEALLVSFSVLDNAVQKALLTMLSERGVKKPKKFLRAIPDERLKTYLGPVLKILMGRSLQEDDSELWKRLGGLNKRRNQAMHEATDIPYKQAKEGIETVRDILIYLGEIPRQPAREESPGTVLPQIDIEYLPFLLE